MSCLEDLEQLHAEMRECSACELCETRTQVVPGDGPATANIVFFGEGPGESEDLSGKPFDGRSGTLLRTQMRRAHIDARRAYITNTVRCRPPENADPTPAQAEACWPWTERTLSVIQPKVIVTLGKPALNTISRKLGFKVEQGGITKVAGVPIYLDEKKCYVYPMFHPSYALRRVAAKKDFEGHMSYLGAALPFWLERP